MNVNEQVQETWSEIRADPRESRDLRKTKCRSKQMSKRRDSVRMTVFVAQRRAALKGVGIAVLRRSAFLAEYSRRNKQSCRVENQCGQSM